MTTHAENFTIILIDILNGQSGNSKADWLNLAITGEELRRSLLINPCAIGSEALARYDMVLQDNGEVISTQLLGVELEEAFERLAECRNSLGDEIESEDLLIGIDEVLYVIAASGRCHSLTKEQVLEYGKQAKERAAELAPKLPQFWNMAEERACCLGPDPDYPGLYDWIEEFAELSRHRSKMMSASSKEARIDAAVKSLTK